MPDDARTTRIRTALRAVFLILVLALGGCGDPPATGDAAAAQIPELPPLEPLDACAVLATDLVEDILGASADDPTAGMNSPGDWTLAQVSQCSWPARRAPRVLTILIRRSPTDQNTPVAIDQVRTALRSAGVTLRNADGPGDVAFWTGTELHVFRGQREYLIVGIKGLADVAAFDAARRTASAVLENL